jgi:hypothetical protein
LEQKSELLELAVVFFAVTLFNINVLLILTVSYLFDRLPFAIYFACASFVILIDFHAIYSVVKEFLRVKALGHQRL